MHWHSFSTPEAADRAVAPNTQYNYTITVRDMHGNGFVPTPITVQTPDPTLPR